MEEAPQTSSRSAGWLRAVQVGALATALALGIMPFAADARRAGRVPDEAAIAAATRVIRAEFRPGDAVLVDPSWYPLPWHALEKIGPGTEAWPFPALFASEDADPVAVVGHRRLWVIGAFDRAPDAPEVVRDRVRSREDVALGVEHVALARYELDPITPLRTLTKDAEQLVVRRGPEGGKMTPCKWRGERHRCGRDAVLDLHLEDRIVSHIQVAWLMAVPGERGEVLEVDWPKLPAGGSWLYLRAGFTMQAVREPAGTETTVVVLVDGREVDRFVLAPHRYVLERRAIRLAGDQPTTVTLRIGADELDARELMVQADVLPTLGEGLRAWATNVVD